MRSLSTWRVNRLLLVVLGLQASNLLFA